MEDQIAINCLDGFPVDKIDSLHIPHVGFTHWVSHTNSTHASKADKENRKFGVKFCLEDLNAGTNWTHISIEQDIFQSIGEGSEEKKFWFEKNNKNYLSSILVEVFAKGPIEAFKKSVNHILSVLSVLSFFYRRPLKLGSIYIEDKKYNAIIYTRKFFPPAKEMVSPKASFEGSPVGGLFSIYREGMNSVDLAYRYICFFKIYEAWFKRAGKFFGSNKEDFPRLTITRNLLGSSYRKSFHLQYLNKDFKDQDVYSSLEKMRHYLVHPVLDRQKEPAGYYNFDLIETLEGIEVMANLIERIATKILDSALLLMSEKNNDIQVLLNIYKIN